jgi:hypothetical protein
MSPLSTLDFDVGFHFPGNSRLDPFLKLAFGIGTTTGGSVAKGGVILGLRINVAPHFNIILDGAANSYSIVGNVGGGEGVSESLGHIGLGTNF